MATTYEEEKKRVERPAEYVAQTYAPPTPTATYAGSDSEAMINAIRQRYSEVADPRRQAEEDARIQRGRQFWTGANLFANVIANAINANGTARNAPNMTWNNEMERNMYATWRDADKQLRADRKEAQQRYDAMTLQDAQMRLNDKQAADKAALDAYNMNFNLQNDAAKANWNRELKEYDTQEARDREDEVYAKKLADAREDAETEYKRRLALANIRHSGGGRSGGSKKDSKDRSTKYDTKVGGRTIMADSQNEKNYNMYSLANDMYEYYSSLSDDQKKAIFGDADIKQPADSNFARQKFVEKNLEKFLKDEGFMAYAYDNYGDFIDFGEPVVAEEEEAVPQVQQTYYGGYLPLSSNPQVRREAMEGYRPSQQPQPQQYPQFIGQWQRRPSAKTDPMMPVSDSTMNRFTPNMGAKPIIPKKEEETSPWNFDKL